MPPAAPLLVLRVALLVALCVSAMLEVDYTSAAAEFCSAASDCGVVRASGYGYLPGGIPLPLVGLVAFGALFLLSLVPRAAARRLTFVAALAGGLAGIGFLVLQLAVIHALCSLCAVVDTAAIIAAAAAARGLRTAKAPESRERLAAWAWVVLAALAVAAPLVWPRVRPEPPVPAPVLARFVDGKVNVVEFVDFECPFCRRLHHDTLKELVSADDVHVVRYMVPLPFHTHAGGAARAYVCAEAQGRADAMADVLFELEDLSLDAIRYAAVAQRLEMGAFNACLEDPATRARVEEETQLFRDQGWSGLPTTFVGMTRIGGAMPRPVFEDAFALARSGEGEVGVPAPAFLGGVAMIALLALGLGVRRREETAAAPGADAGEGEG